jgi:DNA repair exonuclease SbcCD ATPase subunit
MNPPPPPSSQTFQDDTTILDQLVIESSTFKEANVSLRMEVKRLRQENQRLSQQLEYQRASCTMALTQAKTSETELNSLKLKLAQARLQSKQRHLQHQQQQKQQLQAQLQQLQEQLQPPPLHRFDRIESRGGEVANAITYHQDDRYCHKWGHVTTTIKSKPTAIAAAAAASSANSNNSSKMMMMMRRRRSKLRHTMHDPLHRHSNEDEPNEKDQAKDVQHHHRQKDESTRGSFVGHARTAKATKYPLHHAYRTLHAPDRDSWHGTWWTSY